MRDEMAKDSFPSQRAALLPRMEKAGMILNCSVTTKEITENGVRFLDKDGNEQFAEADDRIVLFSTGTYQLEENADYIYEHPGEAGNGQITIHRNKKFTSQGITDYDSEHTYDLGTLGFYPVYTPDNPDKQVTAAFYGDDKQPFTKKDGGQDMLDTWWIYFSDGTFVQFAILEDKIVLFSEGVYKLSDGSSFGYEVTPEKDVITIQRTKKYVKDSLQEYHSSHDYELSTLGLVRIVSIGQ